MEVAERPNMLAPGDMLGCYRIDGLLGKGGFGLTYLALDTSLEMSVAIKEYMPEQFASRASDSSVRPKSPDQRDVFSWGLTRFISEARTLAKFRHPNIVRVLSVFERNRTAYMVMEHERGVELKHLIDRPEFRTEANLKRIMGPVMDGLAEVHRHDYIHRDIKPANILIREDDTPVLLDFGSARLATGAQTQALTSLVSGGYAPLEQYDEAGSNQQGPWTDIYALGAVLYFSVTGNAPADSTLRGWARLKSRSDPLVPLRQLSPQGYSPAFCEAIDWALRLEAADRPQSIDAWRQHLLPDVETVPVARARRESVPLDTTAVAPGTMGSRARAGAGSARRPTTSGRIGTGVTDRPKKRDVAGASGGRNTRGPAVATSGPPPRWRMISGVVLTLVMVAAAGIVTYERWLPEVTEPVTRAAQEREDAAARLAEEEERQAAAEARQLEEERQAAATRQAETERREAAARQAEEERQAAAARQAETERREAAAARQAEEERQAAAARQAETERREAAAERQAEEERQAAAARQAETERREAAARQAEEERQAAAARQAETERREAAARQAEEERRAAEERQPEPERIDPTLRISEADLNVVTGRFNALKRAIQLKDKTAIRQLTVGSERKYAYFDYLFDSFETIDVSVSGVQASRRDQTIRAVLELERMMRSSGNMALPPSEFRRIPLQSTRQGEWSDIQW